MSDWLVLVDWFVNMYVVHLRMLIICTCMSTILCGWLNVTCILYRIGRVDFLSKDEREMWQIVSWECGILVVNHQVVLHAFAWIESQLLWRRKFFQFVFNQLFLYQDVRVHGDVHMMWHLLLWRRKGTGPQVIFLHDCFSRLMMFLMTRCYRMLEGPCLRKRLMISLHYKILTWETC